MSTAYLLVHGLAGTRNELTYLYDYLANRRLKVYYVILKGHEGSYKDLASASYKEWIESVEDQINLIKTQHDNIAIVGFSMGGLICASLYNKNKFTKMVFVNTPIKYWDTKKIVGNVYNDLLARKYCNIKRYFVACTDKPLRTLIQFVILLAKCKKEFASIKCRTLVIQSKNDDVVHQSSSDYIFNALHDNKQIKLYDGGSHQIFNSEISELVCKDIYDFLMNSGGMKENE